MASTGTDNPTPLLGQPDLLSGSKTKTKKNVATDSGKYLFQPVVYTFSEFIAKTFLHLFNSNHFCI